MDERARQPGRSPVECPRTPRGLPVALLVDCTRPHRARRLAWIALGTLALAVPVFSAVRSASGSRGSAGSHGAESGDGGARAGGRAVSGRAHRDQLVALSEPRHTRAESPGADSFSGDPGPVDPRDAAVNATGSSEQPPPLPPTPVPHPAATAGTLPPAGSAVAASGSATPEQDLAHLKLWSSAFAGTRLPARYARALDDGSVPPDVHTLARFLGRSQAHGALAPAPEPRTSLAGLRSLALAGEGVVALWLVAPAEGWGDPVKGARVTVRGLSPGRWRVTWLDDVSGTEIATEERGLSADAQLEVPGFARHVAAILERADEG